MGVSMVGYFFFEIVKIDQVTIFHVSLNARSILRIIKHNIWCGIVGLILSSFSRAHKFINSWSRRSLIAFLLRLKNSNQSSLLLNVMIHLFQFNIIQYHRTLIGARFIKIILEPIKPFICYLLIREQLFQPSWSFKHSFWSWDVFLLFLLLYNCLLLSRVKVKIHIWHYVV